MKTFKSQSGHTIFINKIKFKDLPKNIQEGEYAKNYSIFYVARNFDSAGVVFMYLAAGNKAAPKEIVVWYANGAFWSSFGTTLEKAVNGAQKDGWLYA